MRRNASLRISGGLCRELWAWRGLPTVPGSWRTIRNATYRFQMNHSAPSGHGGAQQRSDLHPLPLAGRTARHASRRSALREWPVGPLRPGRAGSEPHGLHEDRVAMMLDDGGVPEFARYGGYITIGDGLVGLTNEVDGAEVEAHPYLGECAGPGGGDKISPGHAHPTRRLVSDRVRGDAGFAAPRRILPRSVALAGAALQPARHVGRSVRFEARYGDSGRSGWSTNWIRFDTRASRMMFDPETGRLPGFVLGRRGRRPARLRRHLLYHRGHRRARSTRTMPGRRATPSRAVSCAPGRARAPISAVSGRRWADGYWDVTLPACSTPAIRWTTRSSTTRASITSPSRSTATPPAGAGTMCRCPTRWA
jgi:hypothetical protein